MNVAVGVGLDEAFTLIWPLAVRREFRVAAPLWVVISITLSEPAAVIVAAEFTVTALAAIFTSPDDVIGRAIVKVCVEEATVPWSPIVTAPELIAKLMVDVALNWELKGRIETVPEVETLDSAFVLASMKAWVRTSKSALEVVTSDPAFAPIHLASPVLQVIWPLVLI